MHSILKSACGERLLSAAGGDARWLFDHDEGADLDALARHRVFRRVRQLEGGMRGKSRTPVFETVPTLDQDDLVIRHMRRGTNQQPIPIICPGARARIIHTLRRVTRSGNRIKFGAG